MKSIRAIVCCCAFLLALGAQALQASPSGQSGQPQDAPPPNQQTQPPQGAPQTVQPPTIDEQVKALSLELNLNTDQQAKLKTILEDQRQQGMTIVGDKTTSREDKIQKLRGLRESTIAKVRAMLNDDQKKQLDQMLQEPDDQAPHSNQPGNAPPK